MLPHEDSRNGPAAERRGSADNRQQYDGDSPARRPVPAIKREKLVIEQIGFGGLLALWSPAVAVAFAVPYACGLAIFKSQAAGALAGLLIGGLVGARALFWVRASQAQLRKRRGLRHLSEDSSGAP